MKKILILAANPRNTSPLRLDEEIREIGEALRRSIYRQQFDLHTKSAVRLKDIRRALLDFEPQIVHFCGHAEESGIMVEDEEGYALLVNPDALSELFELFSGQIECVLLNACYSESQAEAIAKHIDYVTGTRYEITDKIAIEFTMGFYDALGAGKSFEDAFKFGRNAIQLHAVQDRLLPILKKKRYDESLPPLVENFIGRTEEIKAFKGAIERLYAHEIVNEHCVFLFSGIGGIGKSSLFRELIKQCQSITDKIYWAYIDWETESIGSAEGTPVMMGKIAG